MLITRTSPWSGITHSLDLDVTEEQMVAHHKGLSIQKAFPNLTDSEREFYMTGITAKEWDETFNQSYEEYPSDNPLKEQYNESNKNL